MWFGSLEIGFRLFCHLLFSCFVGYKTTFSAECQISVLHPFEKIFSGEESPWILDHACQFSFEDYISTLRNRYFPRPYSNNFIDVRYNVFKDLKNVPLLPWRQIDCSVHLFGGTNCTFFRILSFSAALMTLKCRPTPTNHTILIKLRGRSTSYDHWFGKYKNFIISLRPGVTGDEPCQIRGEKKFSPTVARRH